MHDVYFVTFRTGTAWVPNTESPQQPGFREHADFLNEVDRTHRLLIGGPLADYSQIQIAMEARSADEARAILANDPWIRSDTTRIETITKWVLLIDPRVVA